MDQRGVAEPLVARLVAFPDPRARVYRATCRMWGQLIDPTAAAWFVDVLHAPSCGCRDDGGALRRGLMASCVDNPQLTAWVARSLAAAPRPAPSGPLCRPCRPCGPLCRPCGPLCGALCGACRRPLQASSGTLVLAARVVSADLVAALRRHVDLPTEPERELVCAVRAGNEPLVRWLVECPVLRLDRLLEAVEHVPTAAVARILGGRLDLRLAWRIAGAGDLHDAGRAALQRAAATGDPDLCRALHDVLEFRPREVGGVFRALVAGNQLDGAQWLVDHVGVLTSAALNGDLLTTLAGRGDVATLEWVAETLHLTNCPGVTHLVDEAARHGHARVIGWAAKRFALGPDELHSALRRAIGCRKSEAVDWLLRKFQFEWRGLGATQKARRLVLTSAMQGQVGTMVHLVERLGLTRAVVAADD